MPKPTRELADANQRLDNLIQGTRILIRDNGATGGWALSGQYLAKVDNPEQMKILLATALVRLAEQES